MSYKPVIIIRTDLKMGKGKIAAQVAHASLGAYIKAGFIAKKRWESTGSKKVVLKVAGLDELMGLYKKAADLKLNPSIIRDAGKTQIKEGTVTCLGIGPEKEEKLAFTKHLKLLG